MKCLKCQRDIPDGSRFCPLCGKKQQPDRRKALKRANGTGTVYKLQGHRKRPWVAAKNRVVIGYYDTKTAALEALGRLAGKDLTERYNMTFEQIFEGWKAEHYRTIGESSRQTYDWSFALFAPLHGRKFRELRTADFQEIIDRQAKRSFSSLNKHKNLLIQMSQWAIREEIVATNFAQFVRLPKADKKEKAIFSDSDIQTLEKDGSDAAKIVLMLIYTGMRIGELFSLPVADYHGAYCIGGEKTDAGRNRIIPIRPEGRGYFKHFAELADGPLLISGYSGQRVLANFRRRDYYPLLDRLGIERKPPHATRHTYASRARRDGMKPEVLQKILGHANYATTAEIYVHSDIKELVAAVEAV